MLFNNTSAVHTSAVHNSIHNTLLEAGWTLKHTGVSSPTDSPNTYVYRNKDPYDEFILEYTSPIDLLITVPIPFRGKSLAYQKTFSTDNIAVILNYLEIHLGNYR
jgi:hypothetical protein